MTLWALLLLAMWQSRQGMRPGTPPSVMRRSAWVALLYLGVHNFWDFNLELGALAVPAVLLAALVQRPSQWNLGAVADGAGRADNRAFRVGSPAGAEP